MKADFHHASIASLAYNSPTPSTREKFKELGYPNINFLNNEGAQAYIAWNDDHVTIAFRGTEPKQLSDVKADLKAWKSKSKVAGKVHDGFYDEIEKIWNKLKFDISTRHKGKSISICGHSLGGAMATICAARLSNEGFEVVLYTFGSPRVGNKKFIKSFNCCHHRWVNNNDAVPKVPLALMGFRHHGELHYLNHYGNVRNGLSMWQRFKDSMRGRWAALKKFQVFDGVYDHSVTAYAKKICKNCKD